MYSLQKGFDLMLLMWSCGLVTLDGRLVDYVCDEFYERDNIDNIYLYTYILYLHNSFCSLEDRTLRRRVKFKHIGLLVQFFPYLTNAIQPFLRLDRVQAVLVHQPTDGDCRRAPMATLAMAIHLGNRRVFA